MNVFQHSVEISVTTLIWFGNFLIRGGFCAISRFWKTIPPPCREVFLIVNCSYHLKNLMFSFNLCKPQKFFDTFSCIPLDNVSNVWKLAQASWGEKREWNKWGILLWFQFVNQSPSSKEAALEIFPPVARTISRRAFSKIEWESGPDKLFMSTPLSTWLFFAASWSKVSMTYLILESCFHSSPSCSLQYLIHDLEYLVSKNHLASNFANVFIEAITSMALLFSLAANNDAYFGASIFAFYRFLYRLGMVYCSCHIDRTSMLPKPMMGWKIFFNFVKKRRRR